MVWHPIRPRPDRPLIVAHQGSPTNAPENTLAGYELAVVEGAEIIEVDVHLTADDELVVVHDDSLERTTDVAQRFPGRQPWWVRDHTLAEIRQLEAGCFGGEVQRVPTLHEVLELVRRLHVGLLVETKHERAPDHLEAAIAEEVRRLDDWQDWVSARLMVGSFDHGSLVRSRDLLPGVHLAFIVGYLVARDGVIVDLGPITTAGLAAPGLTLATLRDGLAGDGIAYLGSALIGEHGEAVDDLSADTIDWFRRGGVEVNLLSDDADQMRSLAERGMSSVLTNRPAVLARVLGVR
jgi:glycerophosphoryl diester phosphodiesterase